MKFLILAILCSTFNHLLFKAFSRFRVDLLSVIVVNYTVCISIGYGSSIESLFRNSIFIQDWYPFSVLQGILFVGCLFILGRTTEKKGVTAASIATRLSVAIPTIAAFFLYGDLVTPFKLIGIVAAGFALYLSCTGPVESLNSSGTMSILPFTLFFVFGMHSTLIKFVQERFLGDASYHAYVMSSFLSAFLISGTILAWRLWKGRQKFRWKDLLWGLALGSANYGAIYFLIKALSVSGGQSSQIFPTIGISVVILSSFGAWFFFKERPGWRMLGAIAIGVGSIFLINVSFST